jgi:hypothetical protein
MNHYLYTFLGTVVALKHTTNQSQAPDRETALAACADLAAAGDAILTELGADASDEAFKAFFATQVTTVLEAVETLKCSSLAQEFNQTLRALLEYYYTAADSLMGGGTGSSVPWPPSLSSSV